MKHMLSVAAATIAGLCPLAEEAVALDAYGKLSVGDVSDASVAGFDLDGGFSYGAAVGVEDIGPFRLELGAERLAGDALAGAIDAHAWVYSGTALLDLRMGDSITLFAGAGLNYSNASANVGFGSMSMSGDGWHWTAGAEYSLSERLSLEAGYTDYQIDYDAATLDAGKFGLALRFDL